MMKENKITPPKLAQRFLQWYCKASLLEDLEGDLNEYFERNCKTKSVHRARFIYIIDVLKFLRPYTIRKFEFLNLLIHWVMIGSYVKTSGRNIVRNKLFSSINIVGLAISMSVGLVIIAMLRDSFSYDQFHEKHDRIYRVVSQHQWMGNKDSDYFATTSLKAGKSIKESFSGIEDAVILVNGLQADLTFDEKTIPLRGFWSDESFFNIFSFPMLQGNPATALKDPFSLVLTERSALKLFNKTDVVGKTVIVNDERAYTVTGVMKDIPALSHLKFDMLASLSTRIVTEKDNKDEMSWNNMWYTYVYIVVPEKADLLSIKTSLDKLSEREDKTIKNTHIEMKLQALDDIITGENYSNQAGPVIGNYTVWILGSLSLVVIISACFNYTNLSVARSFRRSKEVGIRKTVGAMKSHVVFQFVTESVIIALIALVFSFLIFLVIRPHFISIEPSLQKLLVLDLTPGLIGSFVLFAVMVGILAGIFPALYFGKMKVLNVLKNVSAVPMLKGITMRKALIVFQYSISIMAICFTIVIYRQYQHFISYDLGFSTENILNIRLQGNKAGLLEKELREMSEVKGISQSSMIAGIGWMMVANMVNPNDPNDSSRVYFNVVDENYIPLHDHVLLAGENFSARASEGEETDIIVNEQVLKRFDIADRSPAKAVGEIVELNGKKVKIIGVIKDFEYGRANNRTGKEVIMRYSNKDAAMLNVKIISQDWPATYSKLESIWKKVDPVHTLDAKFHDEQIQEAFAGLKGSMKVAGFLAFLVIVIATIGLLGMVIFTTEIRIKEISIRKVLGAGERGLLLMLSRGFFTLLVVAAGIAVPIVYIFFEKVLLPNIANHAPLHFMELFMGVGLIMLLALVMICSQTLKVARTNPSDVLKTE